MPPQQLPSIDLSDIPDDLFEGIPDDEDDASFIGRISKLINPILDKPVVKDIGRWLSTGDPREPNPNRKPLVTGMQGSLLPEWQHGENEGWPEYLMKGAYNTLIQPLGSGPGMIGASQPKPRIPLPPSPKLLGPSTQPTFITGPTGIGRTAEANVPPNIAAEVAGMVNPPTGRTSKGQFDISEVRKYFTGKPDLPYELPSAPKKVIDVVPKKVEPIPPSIMRAPSAQLKAGEEKISLMNEATALTKTMMASFDLSAPLRQGLPLIHKKEWWTSLDDMFKSMVSDKQYNALMESIQAKSTFELSQKSGLSFTGMGKYSQREEAFMSKWAEKIPGVKASERAYVGFLNKLRSDTFDALVNDAVKAGHDINNPELTRGIAKFVNTATGRGSLGSLEKAAVELNYVLFSPRLISSRLTMLNPAYYVKAEPFVRKEALKSLLAIATAGGTVSAIGKLAGGSVSNDPVSSDFGKVKIGNTRLDPYGGFQQYIVAANRLISGESTSSSSGKHWIMGESFAAPTRLSTTMNFGRSKLSPVMSFITDIFAQKDYSGKPISVPKEIKERFTPMVIGDIMDLYEEDPSLLPLGIPAAFGMGVQSYK